MFGSLLICALLACPQAAGADDTPETLLTTAERSGYQATARHAEVVALLDHIAAASRLAGRLDIGCSGEGRVIPALIITDPLVATPEEAAEQIRERGKLMVMAIGNIHGGEVCGKEALGMLARELALAPSHSLLKDLIVILAPIYNTDGNEQFGKDNRRGQIGPAEGMGRRTNAAGLDLNRDFIKLEAPETRALVAFVDRWDPAMFIDTHTTNGSYHRYVVTYEGPKTPAGSGRLIEFTRDQMFPALTRAALERYKLPTFFYGNFNREHTRWTTYEATARFGTSYIGLRNRISILSEAYSYATYKQRVLGTRDFVKTCFEYAAANKRTIRTLLAEIDRETISAGEHPGKDDLVALRSELAAGPNKVSVAGFVEERQDAAPRATSSRSSPTSAPASVPAARNRPRRDRRPRIISTGEHKDYEVELWTHFRAAHAVRRPYAYLLPAGLTEVAAKLRQHGVQLETLAKDTELVVEVYRIDEVRFAEREFQKHRLARVEVTARTESRRISAGTLVVRTAQPLGNLVVYLLEPECEDGLTAWNYFDAHLRAGADFPVLRVAAPVRLNGGRR